MKVYDARSVAPRLRASCAPGYPRRLRRDVARLALVVGRGRLELELELRQHPHREVGAGVVVLPVRDADGLRGGPPQEPPRGSPETARLAPIGQRARAPCRHPSRGRRRRGATCAESWTAQKFSYTYDVSEPARTRSMPPACGARPRAVVRVSMVFHHSSIVRYMRLNAPR